MGPVFETAEKYFGLFGNKIHKNKHVKMLIWASRALNVKMRDLFGATDGLTLFESAPAICRKL